MLGKVSRVARGATSVRTLTTYEMVSMGLDSGSTSDKHRASNPVTASILVIRECSIPFVTELWISVSCTVVNLKATNSIPFLSGCFHGGRAVEAKRLGGGGGVFGLSWNSIASGS